MKTKEEYSCILVCKNGKEKKVGGNLLDCIGDFRKRSIGDRGFLVELL